MTADLSHYAPGEAAWAAFVGGRAALVLPRHEARTLPEPVPWRPQHPAGWDTPYPDWTADFQHQRVRILHRGHPCYETDVVRTWPRWREAAQRRASILLISGPFDDHHDYAAAVRGNALLLLVVPLI
ncbi:hypothetical protein [Kitasatospora sp. NPDC056531]|uniref:hypothetical protein n=1 Tax=Kitasatospora sp. NPDC056531 TaxID=3345856 RepID=UPI00369E6AEA